MRILVIEDDAETADFVSKGLAGDSHDTSVARGGKEGLRRAMAETGQFPCESLRSIPVR